VLVHLFSDLHREFGNEYIPEVKADVLIIAGDLDTNIFRVLSYLEKISEKYDHVIYVTGNHEYYNKSIKDFNAMLSSQLAGTNVYFLDNDLIEINGVSFYGGTMWTDGSGNHDYILEHGINDFRLINNFSVNRMRDLHNDFIDNFPYEVDVVISHHIPDMTLVAPEFVGSSINGAFACTDMGCYLDIPKLWCFGHTHASVDQYIGNTRFICNPHGYEHTPQYKFKRDLVVRV
jgi:predicted phosphodiesterase